MLDWRMARHLESKGEVGSEGESAEGGKETLCTASRLDERWGNIFLLHIVSIIIW